MIIRLPQDHLPVSEVEKDIPQIELLRKKHLCNLYDTFGSAFMNDPIQEYIRAGGKRPGLWHNVLKKRIFVLVVAHGLKRKVGYTVDAGDAATIAAPADIDLPKLSPIDIVVDKFYDGIRRIPRYLESREARKNQKELERKVKQTPKVVLGDKVKEMIYVDMLCVKPECQNLGYGSALLETVLSTADQKGQSVWLYSSNVKNETYYARFGFTTLTSVILGDTNPKWTKAPVVVPLMVREPKTKDADTLKPILTT